MARNIAKTIVEAGAAHRCEIQLSYAIGVARPVSIYVETYGTNTIPEADIFHWIEPTATSAVRMRNSAGKSATPRHWPS